VNFWHSLGIFNNCLFTDAETVKGKMMDMLEKLIHPTDETAEKIKSALTSSTGDYEAVPVDLLIDSRPESQPAQAHKVTMKIKGYCPFFKFSIFRYSSLI
jgi:hypothetical protein